MCKCCPTSMNANVLLHDLKPFTYWSYSFCWWWWGAQRRVNCAQDQERGQANNIGTAEIYLWPCLQIFMLLASTLYSWMASKIEGHIFNHGIQFEGEPDHSAACRKIYVWFIWKIKAWLFSSIISRGSDLKKIFQNLSKLCRNV